MQGLRSDGCFFLDTCVIFSEILKENTARIEKFKRSVDVYDVPCYISDSVQRECDEKIDTTLNFIGDVVRESVRYAIEESRTARNISMESPITSEDIIALEELFLLLQGSARAVRPIPLLGPIGVLEEWAIMFLGRKLEEEAEIDVRNFLVELVKKILALTSSIQDPYDELVSFERSFAKKINVAVDVPVANSLRDIGIHEPDADHIASAVSHQTETNEKTVFVTLDYASIICKKDEIKNLLNMICCDPLYAIHHLTQ